MKRNRYKKADGHWSVDDLKRRKRDIFIIVGLLAVIILLSSVENRIIHFGSDFPVSNTILMFILINLNLLLLILLIFLVFRNIVKLLYDRRRKVMGARLRTRLVVAFISLTLMPTIVLFLFSINFITSSIEFWFNVPVEQALMNSLVVGRKFYNFIEDTNQFYLERIAYQINSRKMLSTGKRKTLSGYLLIVRREFNIQSIEIYLTETKSPVKRLMFSSDEELFPNGIPPIPEKQFKNHLFEGNTHSVTRNLPEGELVRTIGTIPFASGPSDVDAYIVLSTLIPRDFSEYLSSISRGVEEYQQIKLLKEPIRATYYITISIVALLVLFSAVWLGFHLAKTISVPIKELAEGTRKVAEGDLSFSIAPAPDDEMGSLVDSFNKMTRDLRIGREQLEFSATRLREQNEEIEERRRYMEIVLTNVSTGVITLDAKGFVTTINKSAERMLHLRSNDILGKSYKKLLDQSRKDIASQVMEDISKSRDGYIEIPLKLPVDGKTGSFMLRINALKDDTGRHMGIVMVFDDLTEREKAQRMAAWREVARRIAHEVKNPLTPIKLSAQRLKRKYSERIGEPVFDECTRMIIDNVDLIKNLVNEFSAFARFPTANPERCDLPPIVEEALALYRESHPDIAFETHIHDNLVPINLDRRQIKQALINLISNAIEAMEGKGGIYIHISRDSQAQMVRMEIADDGKGIPDEEKHRLFEPYFSTKKRGMGLGLSIVNSIIADHNGRIFVTDNQPAGAKFIIEIPE